MRVVFISSMLPSGHYSQYLTTGLSGLDGLELIVYTDKNPKNLEIQNCGRIKPVWSKSPRYIVEILRELGVDRPDVIHLQQELNMYGGVLTAALFPVLLLLLRRSSQPVVVTIHASVYKRQINSDFVALFHQNAALVRPAFLRMFFHFLFASISTLADAVIVHTELAKDILVKDYGVRADRVAVVPIGIPERKIADSIRENYFLYFGYMVRRKGLQYALEGFGRFIAKNPQSAFTLVLAGGVIKGQERALDEIKQAISEYGLEDRVTIRGYVEEKELGELYGKAYAVVIPALVSMGSSGPLFHAVSHGKCVIASKVGHFLEDIQDLETGILTENARWHEAFECAANNPSLVSRIERNVWAKAKARTTVSIAQRHKEIYRQVLKQKGRGSFE